MPDVALRRIDDVGRFYESVVDNRRAHLEHEIREAESELAEAERLLRLHDGERQTILQTLEGRGALEDFLALKRGLADLEAEAAALRERFNTAEMLEGERTQLEIDRANIKRQL